MKVTLIRHTSVNVPKGVCYGQTDVPLNESFEVEAAVTLANIAEERFDRVYTSPLSRCVRLAEFCGFLDAIREDRMKELNFGDWEMQYFDEIKDPRIQEWFTDYMNVVTTNGESFQMQYDRVAAFLDELKAKDVSQVAVFTHGGAIVCAQVYAGVLTREEAFQSMTPYGGIVKLII